MQSTSWEMEQGWLENKVGEKEIGEMQKGARRNNDWNM